MNMKYNVTLFAEKKSIILADHEKSFYLKEWHLSDDIHTYYSNISAEFFYVLYIKSSNFILFYSIVVQELYNQSNASLIILDLCDKTIWLSSQKTLAAVTSSFGSNIFPWSILLSLENNK